MCMANVRTIKTTVNSLRIVKRPLHLQSKTGKVYFENLGNVKTLTKVITN